VEHCTGMTRHITLVLVIPYYMVFKPNLNSSGVVVLLSMFLTVGQTKGQF